MTFFCVTFVADEGGGTVLENRPTFLGREAEPPEQRITGREPCNEVYGLKRCWLETPLGKRLLRGRGNPNSWRVRLQKDQEGGTARRALG